MGTDPVRAATRIRLRASSAAVLLGCALLLSACETAGYTYHANDETNVVFKVPTDWTRYNKQQMLIRSNIEDSGAQDSFRFLEGYDSSPNPSIDNIFAFPEHPVARVQVVELPFSVRDTLSDRAIRNFIYRVDELLQANQADLLAEDPIALHDGIHGTRIVFDVSLAGNLNLSRENQVIRISQTGILDPARDLLYLLDVHCTAACYNDNLRVIRQVVDSYTVKEQ